MTNKSQLIPLAFLVTIATGMLQFQSCDGLGSIGSPDIDTLFLDKTFIEYTYTPLGNYYVYQEVESGEIDSVYIEEFYIESPGIVFGEAEGYRNTVQESRYCKFKLLGEYRASRWYLGDDPTTETKMDLSYTGMSKELNSNYPIVGAKYHTRAWEDAKIPHDDYYQYHHDSLNLFGTWFYDVVKVQTGITWESAPFIHQTYYSRNIGPVCRMFADGTKWLLVRYGKI